MNDYREKQTLLGKKQYNAIGHWQFPSKFYYLQPFRERREVGPFI